MIIVDYCNVHMQMILSRLFFVSYVMAYLHTPRRLPVRSFYVYGIWNHLLLLRFTFLRWNQCWVWKACDASRMHYQTNRTKRLLMRIYAVRLYLMRLDRSSNRPIVRSQKQWPVFPLTIWAVTTPDSGYSEIRLPTCGAKSAVERVCFILPNAFWPNPNF